MSLSVEQISQLEQKWWRLIEPVLSQLFTSLEYTAFNALVSSTFWVPMSQCRYGTMVDELLVGCDMFIQDEWSVELPKLLIDEGNYVGDVIIDLGGARTPVRLDLFCFVAKIAAIFYAKYIDHDFEPWSCFIEIDVMCEKFNKTKSS